jgi:hypothetical protein
MGFTGKSLAGSFDLAANGDHFQAAGIPITPFTDFDSSNEDPYQAALVTLSDFYGNTVAQTEPVIAVSNEMNCIACHGSDANIVANHPDVPYFDFSQPVVCASCHASNAIGAPGVPQAKSLSEVIHKSHNDKTNNCYMCHPGDKARFLRGVMSNEKGMICQDCHGNMANVADTITQGRRPWLDEPRCGKCHDSMHSEEPGKLFRDSKGHGGLYCSACHGSPHAILPSREERENQQNIALQGFSGTLRNCGVCHEEVPAGAGPHQGTANRAK